MAETRRCLSCKKLFPVSCFSTNGKYKSGQARLMPYCKDCEKKRVKKYRDGNLYSYLKIKCAKCDDISEVRIKKDKESGSHLYICENCLRAAKRK